jgi:hypothetical protein
MKRINIYRASDNVIGWTTDLEDPTAWIAAEVANNSWGLPERTVPDPAFPNWTPAEGQTEADRPLVTLPAEYRVEIVDLPAGYDYAAKRAAAYPPIADYVDGLYHQSKGDLSFIDAYWSKVEAVKAQFPKPEGE